MMKQIEVHGQRVNLYSHDGGCTWSSSPQSIVAYGQRKELLRFELKNSFARLDEMHDLDPDNYSEPDAPKRMIKAKKKNPARSAVNKAKLARLVNVSGVGRVVSDGYARRLDYPKDRVGLLDRGRIPRNGRPPRYGPRPNHFAR